MKFTATLETDLPQISDWIRADPYHKDIDQPEFWLTGNGLLSFCVTDGKGPLCFVRLDDERPLVRLHTQFGPIEEVSSLRLIKGMKKGLPIVFDHAKQNGFDGVIFKSVSSTLITFMQRLEFFPAGNDDYKLSFEGQK